MHFHITATQVEHGLDIASHLTGNGAISNGLETVSDGIKTYEDIHNHNYGHAVIDTAETIYHGATTIIDSIGGDWF